MSISGRPLRYAALLLAALALSFLCFPSVDVCAGERSVIVKFRRSPGLAEQGLIQRAGGSPRRLFRRIPAITARVPEHAIEKLRRHPDVAYVEEDAVAMAIDPLPVVRAAATPAEYDSNWGIRHINADAVHSQGIKGHGIKVAILDTGIDYRHSDLAANYQGGIDIVNDDNNPFDDSTSGHGTHVAGIVAAVENGSGVIGVAPQASLYAVKILDWAGFGSVSTVIAGIQWAMDNDMDIVNMSLSVGSYSQALQDICDAADEAGLLLVAAAGNNYGRPVLYPAAFTSVLAVTAISAADEAVALDPLDAAIGLAAPGIAIYSTAPRQGYKYFSGTSQAAPHVAGTAALLLAAGVPDSNANGRVNDELRQVLAQSARDLGAPGQDEVFGAGLVDAEAALETLAALDPPGAVHLTLTKGQMGAGDTESVRLEDGTYQITITNDSLRRVVVKMREQGGRQKDFTRNFWFRGDRDLRRGRNGQTVSFSLKATGRVFAVSFTPKGEAGGWARIDIVKSEQ